jgi:hypothetical protein
MEVTSPESRIILFVAFNSYSAATAKDNIYHDQSHIRDPRWFGPAAERDILLTGRQ